MWYISPLVFLISSPQLMPGIITIFFVLIFTMANYYFHGVRLSHLIVLCILSLITLLTTIFNLSTRELIASPFIIVSYILMLTSFPKNNLVFENKVLSGLLWSVFLGLFLSIVAINNSANIFYKSLANKGFENIYAITGFTATPQAFATMCLVLLVFRTPNLRITNFLLVFSLFSSINRITILTYLACEVFKNKIFLVVLSICAAVLLLQYRDNLAFLYTLQTLSSRGDMVIDIFNQITSRDIFTLLLGSGSTFIPIDGKWHIHYIESGSMFIMYHFGLLGLLIYFAYCIHILSMFRHASCKHAKAVWLFAVFYFLVVFNLTHEMLGPIMWFVMHLTSEYFYRKKKIHG